MKKKQNGFNAYFFVSLAISLVLIANILLIFPLIRVRMNYTYTYFVKDMKHAYAYIYVIYPFITYIIISILGALDATYIILNKRNKKHLMSFIYIMATILIGVFTLIYFLYAKNTIMDNLDDPEYHNKLKTKVFGNSDMKLYGKDNVNLTTTAIISLLSLGLAGLFAGCSFIYMFRKDDPTAYVSEEVAKQAINPAPPKKNRLDALKDLQNDNVFKEHNEE